MTSSLRTNNVDLTDRFRKKKYHREGKPRGRIVFWTNEPGFRTAKIILQMWAEQKAGMGVVSFSRGFSEQGVNSKNLWAFLQYKMPDLAAKYQEIRGAPLTPKIAYDRVHKAWYPPDNPREHYQYDPKLRPYANAARQFMLRDGPVYFEEMVDAERMADAKRKRDRDADR